MRLITSISVACMSVPGLKRSVSHELPAFAHALSSFRPGVPRSACSCGSTICASTSDGAAARQFVVIVSAGSSTSGNSCTGSLMNA